MPDIRQGTYHFLRRIPLTPKMLIMTLITGIIIWGVLDNIQYRRLKSILYSQQTERLSKEANDSRVHFDNYITAYSQAARLFISLTQFTGYLDKNNWLSDNASAVKYYHEVPPWLPDASVLRKFARIHYAFLLDGKGMVREVYQGWPEPIPGSLIQPENHLQLLSSNQSLMTEIDGMPFVLTAETLTDEFEERKATLMFASPLDNDFISSSQGGASRSQNITALVSGMDQRIIASSMPDLLSPGTSVDSVKDRYLITGKSFFDHGSSDLLVEFTSFISREEYENLSKAILLAGRQQYAISALVFILLLSFMTLRITRNIRGLTGSITDFSGRTFGARAKELPKGDELYILKEQFRNFTDEIVLSRDALIMEKDLLKKAHEDLEKKNMLIEESRRKIQFALDEISSLILQVANRKSFIVRFFNPNLNKCYERLDCDKTECPCHGKDIMRCWQIAGTYCFDAPTGKFVETDEGCNKCPVYSEATSDPIYQIGEHFNNMMHILQLQHKELEEAYIDLKAAQSQILQREKMASIGQLAAGVAHEINNPVSFVMSNLQSLGKYTDKFIEFISAQSEIINSPDKTGAASELGEKRRKLKLDFVIDDTKNLLKESIDGTERIKEIVRNLKSFSRIDEAEHKMADINAGLESTINIVWNELKYKVTLKKEYGDIPMIVCNPGELNQVFMNILINAAQAIEKQGEISISTRHNDSSVVVSISDTGNGIPADKIDRIFEPFYTTKDVGKGTGLGLSIAYDIVKKHNGEIKVDSEAGRGTTFTIRIPERMNGRG